MDPFVSAFLEVELHIRKKKVASGELNFSPHAFQANTLLPDLLPIHLCYLFYIFGTLHRA